MWDDVRKGEIDGMVQQVQSAHQVHGGNMSIIFFIALLSIAVIGGASLAIVVAIAAGWIE